MKILNFGSANIDRVHAVDHIARAGETLDSASLEVFPGGKGLNQSVALSRAGAEVYHAGLVGSDGRFLRELLDRCGVNVDFFRESEVVSGYAIIQVDRHGENSILLFGGANQEMTHAFVDEVLSNFGAGDYIVLQNRINEVPYIVNKAYQKGMKIVLNPSPFNEKLAAVDFNKITYLILNETEAEALSHTNNIQLFVRFMATRYPSTHVVLTLGRRGSLYAYRGVTHEQAAFSVDAVDTTGAGDTFTGFFIAELMRGASAANAMRTASAASAIAVSRKGASSSIPTMREVRERLCVMQPHSGRIKTDRQRQRFEDLLHTQYSTLTLDDVARELNYSRAYAGKWLVAATDKTFSEHLHARRLEVAEELIKTTDRPIADIVAAVGYKNAGFFRKLFYDAYHMTPLQMRKRK